ncbi:MAG: ATP-dependent RecD-like DNA helicase [Actinomycetia bacterium]|nr:ATP-dependent RecD-like DNA helicase [Actinomycetes bacterium]
MRDPKAQQVLRVGGHAGSGKTTIIKEILAEFPELNIAVTTFTGKAAQVLRSKGVPDAINLHQIFYIPDPVKMAEKLTLDAALAVADASEKATIRQQIQRLTAKMFTRVDEIPFDLVIVDEASMVPGRITEDLLRYGKPVLAVGDPAQLGPVERSANDPLFAGQDVDIELTGQHRAVGGVLADVAHAARDNRGLPPEVLVSNPDYLAYDAILVSTNKTRWRLTREIRKLAGKPVAEPVPGDELMVLRNTPALGLFNGSTFVVAEVEREWAKRNAFRVTTTDGDVLSVDSRGFSEQTESAAKSAGKSTVVATFCEAMTVHKAQGSEWDRVLVAENLWAPERDDKIRARYTAVTRAREAIHVADESFLRPVK